MFSVSDNRVRSSVDRALRRYVGEVTGGKERCFRFQIIAFVAQWIERLVAVQKVAGPIPAERTFQKNAQKGVLFNSILSQPRHSDKT